MTSRRFPRVLVLASFCVFAESACSNSSGPSSAATDGGAGPYLTALAVSTSESNTAAPLVLVPPFSSNVHDYYVGCAAGTNALSVSMTASSGAESSLLQPKRSPSRPTQVVSLSVTENQAIVASATDGKAQTSYWVRCLPHDFPKLQMVANAGAGASPPGYYLVGNTGAPTGEGAYAMVLDGQGVPVWYYREPSAGIGVFNVDNVVSGDISFIGTLNGLSTPGHPYEIHRLDGSTATDVSVSGSSPDEHELRVLPNGDYLVLWSPMKTGVNLTGLTLPLSDGGVESFGPNSDILECDVMEIDPKGSVVWQWDATDHFDPVQDMTYLTSPLIGPGGALVVEPFHCNSIEVDAANGNLMISSRHMDSIFYIEKSSGKVLWKMGGATYSKDDATYVPVADPFYRQHDARFPSGWTSACSGGSGQISLFDDETLKSQPARGVVYDVHVASGDCPTDAGVSGATVAWQYQGTKSITATGSFRISADGSRVIGWGESGGLVFSEVDVSGNDLLDFYFPEGSSSYRAVKVPLTAFDLSVLRSTAGELQGDGTSDGGSDDGSAEKGLGTADATATDTGS